MGRLSVSPIILSHDAIPHLANTKNKSAEIFLRI